MPVTSISSVDPSTQAPGTADPAATLPPAPTEQAAEARGLLGRAEALAVGADQGEVLRTVPQDPAGREARDRGGLADARCADQRHDAAVLAPAVAGHGDAVGEACDRQPAGTGEIESRRQLVRDLRGHVGREADLGQLAQQLGRERRAARQIVPGECRELRLEHAA